MNSRGAQAPEQDGTATTTGTEELVDAAVAAIDVPRMVSFLEELVNTPSPTGHELEAARVMAGRLEAAGVEVKVQQFDADRANVIARIPGTGGGPTLMLNGHLDTSYTGEEEELVGVGYKNTAVIVDDKWMYGNGVHNMKNALASYVALAEALSASGVRLAGDVVIAGVAGEIEKAPYGRFQGPDYEGFGTGTTYALSHGLDADMCILGEPTANTIGLSNLGVNWIRLSTTGTMAHTQHAETAVNAIYEMQVVMEAIRDWIPSYREKYQYNGIKPACDITAIEGGWPWRVSRTPVFCDLFLCVRMPPGVKTTDVRRELAAVLDPLDVDVAIDVYVSHQGSEISTDEPLVRALHAHHLRVTGAEPTYQRRGSYMDSSALNAHGIPTVVYGPSGRLNVPAEERGWSPAQGEHLHLDDLATGTRVVAATVVDLCNRTMADLRPHRR